MHYTYVLLSDKDGRFYTGFTADFFVGRRKKLERH